MSKNDSDQLYKEAQDKIDQMMEGAQQRSYEIIHDARDLASQIIQDAESLSEEIRNQYINEFKQASSRQSAAYEALLEQVRKEALESIKQITVQLQSSFVHEVEGFKNSLQSEAQKAGQDIALKLAEQLKTVGDSLEVYKKQRLSNIDQDIQVQINEISKQVFGKTLSKVDQLQSVKQAIQEAKQKHGW